MSSNTNPELWTKLEQAQNYLMHAGELINEVQYALKTDAGQQQTQPTQTAASINAPPNRTLIKDLRIGDKNVTVAGRIVDYHIRSVSTAKGPTQVGDAIINDGSGSIKLSIWGEKSAEFKAGDIVTVENGYISTYRDTLQLNAGKFGTISKGGN
jgi:lysyl-tRNA synthetase class II